jgi:hypothetical protein
MQGKESIPARLAQVGHPLAGIVYEEGAKPSRFAAGLRLFISVTNTLHPAVGAAPAENYPAGWLSTALAVVNEEPQIAALIWFIDLFPHDDLWDLFSLSERRGQMVAAAEEFERLLQAVR